MCVYIYIYTYLDLPGCPFLCRLDFDWGKPPLQIKTAAEFGKLPLNFWQCASWTPQLSHAAIWHYQPGWGHGSLLSMPQSF